MNQREQWKRDLGVWVLVGLSGAGCFDGAGQATSQEQVGTDPAAESQAGGLSPTFSEQADARVMSLLEAGSDRGSPDIKNLGELAILSRYRFLTREGRSHYADWMTKQCQEKGTDPVSAQAKALHSTIFWNQVGSAMGYSRIFESSDAKSSRELHRLVESLVQESCESHPLRKDAEIAAKRLGILAVEESDCQLDANEPSKSDFRDLAQTQNCEDWIKTPWLNSDSASDPEPRIASRMDTLRMIENLPQGARSRAVSARLLVSPEMQAQLPMVIGPVLTAGPHVPLEPSSPYMGWNMSSRVQAGDDPILSYQANLPEGSRAFAQSRSVPRRGTTSAPSIASVEVQSYDVQVVGSNQFTASAQVVSFVRGGYQPPEGWNSQLKHGKNYTSKISYTLKSSILIPACRAQLDCEPLLQVQVHSGLPDGATSAIEVLGENQQVLRVIQANDQFVLNRLDGDHIFRIRLERKAEHAGGCCHAGRVSQSFRLTASPLRQETSGSNGTIATLGDFLSKWKQMRSVSQSEHDRLLIARDLERELVTWARNPGEANPSSLAQRTLSLRLAAALLVEMMDRVGVTHQERQQIEIGLSLAQGMVMSNWENRIPEETQATPTDLEPLDYLIDQWIDAEEIPVNAYQRYKEARNTSNSAPQYLEMDELLRELLNARDRRILLISDLVDYRDQLAIEQEQRSLLRAAQGIGTTWGNSK